jgi:hypothetical protein
MALNVTKLAARLKEIEDGAKNAEFANLLWKPKEGPQVIRIVPYKFNPEDPFISLQFYYKLAGKTYLAPCTFGKPDPVQECVERMRSSGSNEEKEVAKTLTPTKRTYCPIIVRGEEALGVRFWGFGVQVLKQLLALTTKPAMWGDITSLADGNDLEVVFKKDSGKRNAKGEPIPETTITPYPTKTPVVDPTKRELLDKIRDQKDILTIFPLKSYEELKEAVNKWLNPTDESNTGGKASAPAHVPPGGTPAPKVETPAPAAAPASVTPSPSSDTAAVSGEFDDFFATPTK